MNPTGKRADLKGLKKLITKHIILPINKIRGFIIIYPSPLLIDPVFIII